MATGLRFILSSSLRARAATAAWRQPRNVAAPVLTSLDQRRYAGGMPQLDVTAFLTQYSWTLITLFCFYTILVNSTLPRIQQQLAIRSHMQQFQFEEEKSDVVRPEVQVLRSLFGRIEDK